MSATSPTPPLAGRWSTRPALRSVLAIAHNVTAATRLFDAVGLISTDDRVRIVFARTGSSAFDHGTEEFLAERGVRQIPWEEALDTEYNLAVSASHGGDLHRLRAPLLIIPHGMGYNKFLETGNRKPETGNRKPETGNRKPETGNRKPVFGLSSDWLVHDGEVIPSTLLLSHTEQVDRLRRACPEAVPHAVVAGDLCLDQLRASMPLRPTYRRALGVPGVAKLIVVSSTWGPDSLLGNDLHLAQRLAEELPVDEYRVAIALHPNIWYAHSVWQVRQWLAACERAGVAVLPDADDWKAAIVSADLVIGDQGSVPFYAAALGHPILLAAAPVHTVASDSPIARLLAAAPRLTDGAALPLQVAKTIAGHTPGKYAEITALTTSEPGRAAMLLRAELYRLMGLDEPAAEAEVHPLPLPARPLTRPVSHLVLVELTDGRTARLTRYPAERLRSDSVPRGCHLAVDVQEPRHRWLEVADVIIGDLGADTTCWIDDTLRRLPGCLLAAAPESATSWLLGDRNGALLRIRGDGRLFASVAYQAIAAGATIASLTGVWRLSAQAEVSVEVTLADP